MHVDEEEGEVNEDVDTGRSVEEERVKTIRRRGKVVIVVAMDGEDEENRKVEYERV